MTLKLYHCANARSFRPLWMLEEMGLSYELKVLPFPPRVHAKEYLAINPLGTIPAFFDGDLRMTESSAICEYLGAKYGPTDLALTPQHAEYGAYLNWLYHGEATLTFPQTIVLRYTIQEPGRADSAVQDYGKWFNARLRLADAALKNADYLCAGRFTAADISVGYALMLARTLNLDGDFSPTIRAYWERISAREGFARAKESQKRAAAS
jgi:glutathione S-transferase